MHDPMTRARSLWSPIPEVRKQTEKERYRYGKRFNWQVTLRKKNSYFSPFVYVLGYRLYFHSFIELWHTDPKGDAGPACHGRKYWKWHLHHMDISFSSWKRFKQRHITRCAWCGKKSNKELGLVNHQSLNGLLYHAKCTGESYKSYHAHDPRKCYNCKPKVMKERVFKSEAQRVAEGLFGVVK